MGEQSLVIPAKVQREPESSLDFRVRGNDSSPIVVPKRQTQCRN